MPAPAYIISRVADPIFAVVIGVSAAALRINREEEAKGNSTSQTIQTGLRYGYCPMNSFLICICANYGQATRSPFGTGLVKSPKTNMYQQRRHDIPC